MCGKYFLPPGNNQGQEEGCRVQGKIPCVVLAGGVNTIPLYEGYVPGHKALIHFYGKPSIAYTLDAIAKSRHARDHAAIVGPENELRPVVASFPDFHFDFVPEGKTMLESIFNALRHFKNEDAVLMANADIPLITGHAMDEFVEKCMNASPQWKDNIFISVVPREKFTGRFRRADKGMNRFRDAEICHGNLFMVNPRVLGNEDAVNRINTIYNARKSPVQSALATGLLVGLSYVFGVHLLHILTMEQMAKIASARFGIGFVPVLSSYPEIAVDVDEAEDYKLVCDVLNERR